MINEQELIQESDFLDATRSLIKNEDLLDIYWSGSKNRFIIQMNTSGQIFMDNIPDSSNKEYRFFMTPSSLTSNNNLELRRVDKNQDVIPLNEPRKWSKFTLKNVDKIQIIRNDEIVDTIYIGEEQPKKSNEKNSAEEYWDKHREEEIKKNKTPDFKEYGDEELSEVGEDVYNEIINDKELRDAFFKQPSFWDYFVQELTGKKPKGNGILQALEIVSKYNTNKINDRLGGGFIKDKSVKIIPLKTIEINLKDKRDNFLLSNNTEITLGNVKNKFNEDYLIYKKNLLEYGDNTFLQLNVKDSTPDNEDVKLCDLTIFERNGGKNTVLGKASDIKIKFLNSDGYQPTGNKSN